MLMSSSPLTAFFTKGADRKASGLTKTVVTLSLQDITLSSFPELLEE
jgi:hypothetical protein